MYFPFFKDRSCCLLPVLVIPGGEICSCVCSAGFFARTGAQKHGLSEFQPAFFRLCPLSGLLQLLSKCSQFSQSLIDSRFIADDSQAFGKNPCQLFCPRGGKITAVCGQCLWICRDLAIVSAEFCAAEPCFAML